MWVTKKDPDPDKGQIYSCSSHGSSRDGLTLARGLWHVDVFRVGDVEGREQLCSPDKITHTFFYLESLALEEENS